MTRDDFIRQNPLVEVLEARGVKLIGSGNHPTALCPFHEDRNPSFSVDRVRGLWNCHAGCGGGTVIDFLMRAENKTFAQVVGKNGGPSTFVRHQPVEKEEVPPAALRLVKTYAYQDALGTTVYEVCRYDPKTFRQRRPDGKGGWQWGMEGVERVLYRLPDILKSQEVLVVEGEKDADNLARCGFCATTNVGGAGKWLEPYCDTLAGKDVVLCGDNDKAGQAHVKLVFEKVSEKAKSVKIITIPPPHKDASDLILSHEGTEEPAKQIRALIDSATPHVKGQRLPIFTMQEIEPLYSQMTADMKRSTLSLASWIPSLRPIRPLIAGELVLIIGDTGTGKTAFLQALALKSLPLPVVFFEMELPAELLFERFVAAKTRITCRDIEDSYAREDTVGSKALEFHFKNLFICTEPKLTLQSLEDLINRSELKMGCRPKVVFLDYVQLMGGLGKRYERTSDAAEGLKVIAKATRTIMVVASQIQRPTKDKPGIGLHSGKDSGALENSAGLVLGIQADDEDSTLLHLAVLKSTKGGAGLKIECNYFADKMQINERFDIPDKDPDLRPRSPDP